MSAAKRLIGAALVAVVVLAGTVGIVALVDGGDDDQQGALGAPVELVTGTLPPRAGVQTLAVMPDAIVPDVLAWTGSSLLMFGRRVPAGTGSPNAGAVLTPAETTWHEMPDAPFEQPLSGASGVWTGAELVVMGILCENQAQPDDDEPHCAPGRLAAASFDLESGKWRRLETPVAGNTYSQGSFGLPVGWNGRLAIFKIGNELWGYDPQRDGFSRLPDPRVPGADVCLAGDHVVSAVALVDGVPLGQSGDPTLNQSGYSVSSLAPGATTWTESVLESPAGLADGHAPICLADQVLVHTLSLGQVSTLDLATGEWSRVPSPPPDLRLDPEPAVPGVPRRPAFFSNRAWTGQAAIFWKESMVFEESEWEEGDVHTSIVPGAAIAFDPVDRTWSRVASGPLPNGGSQAGWLAWSEDGYAFTTAWDGGRMAVQTYAPR